MNGWKQICVARRIRFDYERGYKLGQSIADWIAVGLAIALVAFAIAHHWHGRLS